MLEIAEFRAAPFLLIKLLVYKIQRDGNRLHEIEWRKIDSGKFDCGFASVVGAVGCAVGL